MALATHQALGQVRAEIYGMGLDPQLSADICGAAEAAHHARARWLQQRPQRPVARQPRIIPVIHLLDVPERVAPFCHDVLLYRDFMGPAEDEAAREWMGPLMWHVVVLLGGWRRVATLPLNRLVDEAQAARSQMPAFLYPPSYPLRPLPLPNLFAMTRMWVRKYPTLATLNCAILAPMALTAGAWLWVFDRTDAQVRQRNSDDQIGKRVQILARRVADVVGLRRDGEKTI